MNAFLSSLTILFFAAVSTAVPAEIPITVINTWEITYASDIQDISYNWNTDQIAIRSNGDGKIYLADPDDLSLQDEFGLPPGIEGFGLNVVFEPYDGRYYVNSSAEPLIFHTDNGDSWTSFPNPAGTQGSGLDFNYLTGDGELFQATRAAPYSFFALYPDTPDYVVYQLPGATGEISGFTVHEVMTLAGYPPFAIIATTRFEHEFLFWQYGTSGYFLWGQEDCPMAVQESLGLFWDWQSLSVFWSYLGTDGKYYISELAIPIFGGIDDSTVSPDNTGILSIASNPVAGSASISVYLQSPESVSLGVYDVSGRLQEDLFQGMMETGTSNWNVTLPSGIYTAVLKSENDTETLRFAVTD